MASAKSLFALSLSNVTSPALQTPSANSSSRNLPRCLLPPSNHFLDERLFRFAIIVALQWFMRISIVTPTFNSIHTLRATLDSVASQDYSDVEHIVVDGGSSDGTLDILKSYPKLRWVSEKDEGHYHAMDKGTLMATGEVVAILNADDCYRPGVLTEVAAAFKKHPDWDALFGDIVFVDGDGQEIFRREEAMFDPQIIRFGFNPVNHQTLFLKKS